MFSLCIYKNVSHVIRACLELISPQMLMFLAIINSVFVLFNFFYMKLGVYTFLFVFNTPTNIFCVQYKLTSHFFLQISVQILQMLNKILMNLYDGVEMCIYICNCALNIILMNYFFY